MTLVRNETLCYTPIILSLTHLSSDEQGDASALATPRDILTHELYTSHLPILSHTGALSLEICL